MKKLKNIPDTNLINMNLKTPWLTFSSQGVLHEFYHAIMKQASYYAKLFHKGH